MFNSRVTSRFCAAIEDFVNLPEVPSCLRASLCYREGMRICIAVAVFVLSGCAEKPQAAVAADTQSATSQALAQPAALAVTASGPQSVTGTVVEAMDASNYTYVRVKTG